MTSAKPRRILVGVDFEEAGDRALYTALAMAAASGDTEVHAVHVGGLEGTPVSRRSLDRAGVDIDRLRGHVHAALEAYRMEHGAMPKVNVSVHETRGAGTAASAIARIARALEVGLVVVGFCAETIGDRSRRCWGSDGIKLNILNSEKRLSQ